MTRLEGGNGDRTIGNAVGSLFRKGATPMALKAAELFLVVIVGIYIAKVCILAMGIYEGIGGRYMPFVTLVIEVAMLFVTLDSLLVVSSRRPKAWKKVVRAAILLTIFNLYYWTGLSESLAAYVVFNPLLITPVALLVLVIMFTRTVRDYYVPLMEDERPLWDWVKYAFVSPLYTAERYHIMYDDGR